MGLISDELYEVSSFCIIPAESGTKMITWIVLYQSLNEICKGEYRNIDPANKLCVENFKMFKNVRLYSFL